MASQPTHRIHSNNEPLPVSKEQDVDYSVDTMNRVAEQDMYPAAQRHATTTTHHNTHSPSHIPRKVSIPTHDDGTPDSRPLQGAEYPTETHRGGESRSDELSGLSDDMSTSNAMPHEKPSFGDKFIGKTEKLAGKIIRDPEMELKGSVRSEG